jgi:hypothetical protein
MELRAALPLDLGQGRLAAHGRTERAVGRHGVEAVGEHEEVRGERDRVAGDPVVARAVDPLVVVLDGLGLPGGEAEALEQPGRKPRGAMHRRPFRGREEAALAQDGGVDANLAEIEPPPGPAQARDLLRREAERAREVLDVACDADRVPVGGGVALVDDVGERLERRRDLAAQDAQPVEGVLEQEHRRDRGGEQPRILGGAEGEHESDAGLACEHARIGRVRPEAGRQAVYDRTNGGVGCEQHADGQNVVRERQASRVTAGEHEAVAAREARQAEGSGAGEQLGPRPRPHDPRREGRQHARERGGPRPDHDHCRQEHGRREPELLRLGLVVQRVVSGGRDQLRADHRAEEQDDHPAGGGNRLQAGRGDEDGQDRGKDDRSGGAHRLSIGAERGFLKAGTTLRGCRTTP